MHATVHEIRLTQRYLWRSAREAIPVQRGLIVEVSADGQSGYGEASAFMVTRYNTGLDRMHADLRRVAPILARLGPEKPPQVWRELARALPESPFLLASLDTAVHDLHARLLGVPLWKALGLAPPRELRSSYSIGLDEPDVMVHKLREKPGWVAYKVKIADPADLSVLRSLREHTDAPFYLDGNCGWKLSSTIQALDSMRELGVELLEQPFPRDAWEDARTLKSVSPMPVLADESIASPDELDACAEAFDGINVKPMKAGGITPAVDLLRTARSRGLVTMLGCMPESSAGVSATAHLGGLADHLDVDAVALNAVDTGSGLLLDTTGHVGLPDGYGSGYLPDPGAGGWEVTAVPAERIRSCAEHLTPICGSHDSWMHEPCDTVKTRHFAALREGRVMGTASVVRDVPPADHASSPPPGPLPADAWQLTDMALAGIDERDGDGQGTALLRTVLSHCVLAGARAVWCQARASAADFYRANGFTALHDSPEPRGPESLVPMYWSLEP